MKVLIADANRPTQSAVRDALAEFGYRCIIATTADEARTALATEQPEILLVDVDLPGLPLTEIQVLRAGGLEPGGYVVALVDGDDAEGLHRVMLAGADDFLLRPFSSEHLHARLQVAERVVLLRADQVEQRRALERAGQSLSDSARTDALTQLGNRSQLEHDLAHLQGQLGRYGHKYAAAVLDLDHATEFAEAYGPLAGDEALRLLAETVAEQLRTGDRAYRFGDTEIVVLFPEQTAESGRVAVERIREALAFRAVPHLGNPPSNVMTASGGVAAFHPDNPYEARTYRGLIERARAALGRARGDGGNRVEVDENRAD